MRSDLPFISEAYWLSPGLGCVLLSRNWDSATPPRLHLEADGLVISAVKGVSPEFFGRFAGYYEREDGMIVFCQRAERHPQINFAKQKVRVAGPFNQWGNQDPHGPWQLAARQLSDGSTLWECAVPKERLGNADKPILFKFVSEDWQWLEVLSRAPNHADDGKGNINYALDLRRSGKHAFLFGVQNGRGLDRRVMLRLSDHPGGPSQRVVPGLSFFDLCSKATLGASLEHKGSSIPFWPGSDHTVFRLFAPRATKVSLELLAEGSSLESTLHPLSLMEDQVTWEIRMPGDLNGRHYYFRVDGENDGLTTLFDPERRLLDPYARACAGAKGPGIVVTSNRSLDKIQRGEFKAPQWKDLTILEGHVRDLTRRAPLQLDNEERLGFRGLTKWIAKDGSYLRDLGINTLELLPVTQFDSSHRDEYHWGYMTTNYFSPCCHYASEPQTAGQIADFAELVAECHRRGLAVLLDVVYNHVGEPAFLAYIDKGYYFLLEKDGTLNNASGCGNTLRAEAAMAKRLIIDSLSYLIKTFDVDGFRFDLAELITVEVLCEVETALKAVKPSVILIAEPWSFRGSIAHHLRPTGIAFWNDGYRDFMADYVRGRGNAEGLRYFMKGSLDHRNSWPAQSINYLQSHDDRCWIDKITQRDRHDGQDPTHEDVTRTHLALAILYCSIGTPMLAQGLDFLHSKRGDPNTYLRGDLNELDYGRMSRLGHTHQYCQAWLRFRASPWGELIRISQNPSPGYLRLFGVANSSAAALLFNADFSLGGRQLLFAINPHQEEAELQLDRVPDNGWEEIASRDHFHAKGHWSGQFSPRENRLRLHALDCRLWARNG